MCTGGGGGGVGGVYVLSVWSILFDLLSLYLYVLIMNNNNYIANANGQHKHDDDSEVEDNVHKKLCKEYVNNHPVYEMASANDRQMKEKLPIEKQNATIVCPEMGYLCFDTLYSHLYNRKLPNYSCIPNVEYPLFVTWKIGLDKRLRGCIGTFTPVSLHDGLQNYALVSACKDSRFESISKRELSQLHVSVSILLNFEDGADYLDWTIGLHGVRIHFRTENGSKRSATFLPQVALDQGWTKVQTIDSLLRKADYRGPITENVRNSIRLTRYTCEKVSVSYQEFQNYRNQQLQV